MRIPIALIGTGYWGPNVAHSLTSTGKANVAWLCDSNQQNLARISPLYPNAKLSTDISELLADPNLKAVAIATPTATHYQIAKWALKAGKHVLIEKPMTANSKEARGLITLAEEKGLILMVGHVFQYHVGIQELKKLINQGELGDVHYISSERTNLGPIRTDVNALWDLASHDIAIICDLLGRAPITVSATGQHFLNRSIEDVVFATFTYPDGRQAHIHASWLNPRKVRHLTVVGSKKMVIWDDLQQPPLQIVDKRVDFSEPGTFVEYKTVCVDGGTVIPPMSVPPPLLLECDHFLDCISSGTRPISDGYSGLLVVELLEASSKSLEIGGTPVYCNGDRFGEIVGKPEG